KEIEPHARELGSENELEGIQEIVRNGNGADRQLRVFNANRDIVEVVSEIADATEIAAAPAPAPAPATAKWAAPMLGAGDRMPDASVWTAPNERRRLSELLADGRALFVFYLFDWSST
ncbi:MAG TPA: hypothetical protein VFF43_16740, partial [Caldimonas sp.]|nr:hypothetical protein [Caldimonas sp.]